MDHGFVKVAVAVPRVSVANCEANTREIISMINEAEKASVEIVCFPELCITAYTCQDLFESSLLIDEAERHLCAITEATTDLNIVAIVGVPLRIDGYLANCAAVVRRGKIIGIVPKTCLTN